MDLAQFNSALQAYYQKHSSKILVFLTMGFSSRKYFAIKSGISDQYVATSRHLDSILQPWIPGFTPKTDRIKFIPEITKVDDGKINYPISHKDIKNLRSSAMGHIIKEIVDQGENFKVPQPIAAQVFNAILDRADEEMEMEIAWSGVRNPPADDVTPGNAADITDGVDKVLDRVIDEGKVTPFSLGAYDSTNTLDYIEEMVKVLPQRLKRKGQVPLFCSPKTHEDYWYNRRDQFGGNTDYDSDKPLTVGPNKNVLLMPKHGMGESKRIFTTVPGNMIMVEGSAEEFKKMTFTLHEDAGQLNIAAHFGIGFGFEVAGQINGGIDKQLVWCNDVK